MSFSCPLVTPLPLDTHCPSFTWPWIKHPQEEPTERGILKRRAPRKGNSQHSATPPVTLRLRKTSLPCSPTGGGAGSAAARRAGTFLDAEAVDGSVASVGDAMPGSCFHHRPVNLDTVSPGHVQLPAHLAHERQPHGTDLQRQEGKEPCAGAGLCSLGEATHSHIRGKGSFAWEPWGGSQFCALLSCTKTGSE